MIPVLFKIGPIPFNSYGVLLVCGFVAGYFLCTWDFKERGIDPEFAYTVFVLGLIAAMVGSRIFHVLEYVPMYAGDVGKAFAGAGFSWYGGLLFSAASTIWVARRKGIHWAPFVDAVSPSLAIGYGFGRVGCFLSGDGCYGPPCAALHLDWSAPFCMAFPRGGVPTTEAVFNTPVFEIAGAIVLFAYLMLVRRRVTTPAMLFAQMIIIHALMRFSIEFVRINPPLALGLSQAQWISLACVGIGAYLIKIGPTIQVPAPAKPGQKKKQKKR
jgi:phosphatidylglycerol:prolipoprotein diacylglycerol transferase